MNKEKIVMRYKLYHCSMKDKLACQISVSELKEKLEALEPGEMVCVELIEGGELPDDGNFSD